MRHIRLAGVNPVRVLCAMYHGRTVLPEPLRLMTQLGAECDDAETMIGVIERERGVRVGLSSCGGVLDVSEFEKRYPGVAADAFALAYSEHERWLATRAWLLGRWGRWSIAAQALSAILLFGEGGGVLFVESVIPELCYLLSLPGAAYGMLRVR